MAVRLTGDYRLQRAARVVGCARRVVQEAEVALDAMRGAAVHHQVFRAEIGDFGHIIQFGQGAHQLRRLQDQRFANGKAGVALGLKQHHAQPLPRQNGPQHRPGQPGADNCDIITVHLLLRDACCAFCCSLQYPTPYRLQASQRANKRATVGVRRVRFQASAVLRMASAWVG